MFKDKITASGQFWGFSDLTSEEELERRELYKQKPNFLLKIKTDDYAGSYERELMAYSLGILSGSCMYYYEDGDLFFRESFDKYFKKYWKREGCRNYAEYMLKYPVIYQKEFMKTFKTLCGDSDMGCEEYLQKHPVVPATDKYTDFYENMLHPTWQVVDDWEEETFYNIHHADSGRTIVIQIRDENFSRTEVGQRLLKRIRKFFKKGYACKIAKSYKKPPKLLSLALFDINEQLVEEFPVD